MNMRQVRSTGFLMTAVVAGLWLLAPTPVARAAGGDYQPDLEFKIQGDAGKGAELYKMYCTVCHGDAGKGDGPAAVALNPKPKDLSDGESMAKISDHEIFIVIRDGGPAIGLSPMMTAWKMVLQDDQKIHDVAAYVRSLANSDD